MKPRAVAPLQHSRGLMLLASMLVVSVLVVPQHVLAQSRRGMDRYPTQVTPRLAVLAAAMPSAASGDSLRHQAAEGLEHAIRAAVPPSQLWVLPQADVTATLCNFNHCGQGKDLWQAGRLLRSSTLIVDVTPVGNGVRVSATLRRLWNESLVRVDSVTAPDLPSAASKLARRLLIDSTFWHLPPATSAPEG